MKVGVLSRDDGPLSIGIYTENLLRELRKRDINVVLFSENGPPPRECDILWDPGLGLRKVPRFLSAAPVPVVATVHGLRSFSMPMRSITDSPLAYIREQKTRCEVALGWKRLKRKISMVIAVSRYGAEEVARSLHINRSQICSIYHGVDHSVFTPAPPKPSMHEPYLLVVAEYSPKKNINRVFQVYEKLSRQLTMPKLVAILPGYTKYVNIEGVTVIATKTLQKDLAAWYAGALAFLFPSLHETFGMPILEAMACGCPVITSTTTACAEIAGDAALLVDPYSVDDIGMAIERLLADPSLRLILRQKGIERAHLFTWEKSADEHLAVFHALMKEENDATT